MNAASLYTIAEIIGTVAFAASGAVTAIRKEMDVFGVAILGLTTAVGGGIIRDLILGITPPRAFSTPYYAAVAVAVSIVIFIFEYTHVNVIGARRYDTILLLMDTLGLAVFVMSGMETALGTGRGYGAFLVIFVGVLTGVGGGVLRDIFAGDRPYIFVKHIYACAAIVGAIVYYFTRAGVGDTWGMVLGIIAIISIRLLAVHFDWNLPKVRND